MKIAIYVEGQTDAAYIRDTLSTYYGFSDLNCKVISLSEKRGVATPHSIENPNAAKSFFIFIAPGDGSVLSLLMDRAEKQLADGFDMVIGLQDMFGQQYKNKIQTVDEQAIDYFKGISQGIIDKKFNENVYYHYAIMEVEAWIMSMPTVIEGYLGSSASVANIKASLGVDLADDPELIFHPAMTLSKIYDLAGKRYPKSRVEPLTSLITKADIDRNLSTGIPRSYVHFFSRILRDDS